VRGKDEDSDYLYLPATFLKIRVLYAIWGRWVYLWTKEKAEEFGYTWKNGTTVKKYAPPHVPVNPFVWLEGLAQMLTSPLALAFYFMIAILIFFVIFMIIGFITRQKVLIMRISEVSERCGEELRNV